MVKRRTRGPQTATREVRAKQHYLNHHAGERSDIILQSCLALFASGWDSDSIIEFENHCQHDENIVTYITQADSDCSGPFAHIPAPILQALGVAFDRYLQNTTDEKKFDEEEPVDQSESDKIAQLQQQKQQAEAKAEAKAKAQPKRLPISEARKITGRWKDKAVKECKKATVVVSANQGALKESGKASEEQMGRIQELKQQLQQAERQLQEAMGGEQDRDKLRLTAENL